ncbi:hypothetical protein SteCoe_5309 [Stentor coeruleus]|uniref:C2H2-type domain-containing protein n=1 Tax=Stentor coeruleus TaxID=5963 RepID=A0A1R2CSK6_9CILI|nr:hypothetical protein SteCoe_5309 [Stentor coeruleus]
MEELPYKCYYEGCTKCYKTKYNLRRHINCNHLYIKEFSCEICSKTFASKQNLQGHERLHKEKLSMPELNVPRTLNIGVKGKHEEIHDLFLSRLYKEAKLIYSVNNNLNKVVMPILPPVCDERTATDSKTKLPVIPILL